MTTTRLTRAAAQRLVPLLSARDWQIIRSLDAARVLTGAHLTRLHFAELSPATQDRVRRRVLARLAQWQVVTRLERTIGGVRAGSTGWIYRLGVAGRRLQALDRSDRVPGRVRPAWTPSQLFLAHTLAVAEIYVELVEASRTQPFTIGAFTAEPSCWWPDGTGGLVKPDAYVVLRTARYEEAAWVEVDRATESLPTLHRKLEAYLSFWHRRSPQPGGIMPRVIVATTTPARRDAISQLITRLDAPKGLFLPTTLDAATLVMTSFTADSADNPS